MRIAFDYLDESVIYSFYGGNGDTVARMTVVDGNRIMRGRLEPGASIGTRTHNESCETAFVITGTGIAMCDGVEEELSAGVCHHFQTGPRTH